MTMEFYFDDKKCDEAGYLKEDCLGAVRNHFVKRNKNGTIREIEEGIFEGTMDDFDAFTSALYFENREWFRETVSGWYWTIPEMESGKERVDMVACAKECNAWK